MTFSKRIVIERYPEDMAQGCGYAGLISGETESGAKWVIWLDNDGKPQIFWPKRDEDGGVTGSGIPLDQGPFGGVLDILMNGEKIDIESNPRAVVSSFPTWNDDPVNGDLAGMKGVIFAAGVPETEGTHIDQIRRFVTAYYKDMILGEAMGRQLYPELTCAEFNAKVIEWVKRDQAE